MERPTDLIQSVSRALRILEEVGRHPRGVAPKVVAARCGLTLSTTYHLLRTLAFEGYLLRDADGDYRLGLELADRYRDLTVSLTRSPRAYDVLANVVRETGHTAYLAGFVEGQVAIVEVVEGTASPHLEDLVPGFDEGAHATALGKALLSTLDRAALHRYLNTAGMRPFTAQTIREADRLDAELTGAAASGWFVEEAQYRTDVSCLARRIRMGGRDDDWYAIGLSASSPVLRARRDTLADVLAQAGSRLAGVG